MHVVLLIAFVLLVFFGPALWVKLILKKYREPRPDLSGTGGELAEHLISRFRLEGVAVEEGVEGKDQFDVLAKKIRLSPYVYGEKSLTAVAVAAHEIGHAIAHTKNDPVSHLSTRYLPLAIVLQRITMLILLLWPIFSLALQIPYAPQFHFGVVILLGLLTVFVQVAILPEEWDASFNKALPILREGRYVDENDLTKIKRILFACALTYVAAALKNILLFWKFPRR
ncbi:zinc metallopeptidase [Marinomonas mediterranea]|jgi:Predicted Zn-dependent protease|uniref:Peptidase membrane zinc metallopeptidase n=1 Tax=Marinomonas mediterranea (strain ATCC 700492 / JCM 21426 / NBRC 103028 / MMB-1) TaxID=717774 RepID=F2JUQ7_MARM1|nr:zinc metallopeptidase [Marinomonas mediterranea]ADZ90472.1 peptidase membrane zinc metallopeptidase [Marinomonas mediterranea MMB-1]WCN16652.1 Zn-dependent protease [Marinomonas mediterranea MMB-1]